MCRSSFIKDSRQTLVCICINHSWECSREASSRFSATSPYFHLYPPSLQCLFAHSYFGSCISKLTTLRVSKMTPWVTMLHPSQRARVRFLAGENPLSQVVLWFPHACHAICLPCICWRECVYPPTMPPILHTLFFKYGEKEIYIWISEINSTSWWWK